MTAKRVIGIVFLLLLTGAWAAGCKGKTGGTSQGKRGEALGQPPQGGEVLATVGNQEITQKEFEYQIAQLSQADPKSVKTLQGLTSFLNSYINRKLVLKEIANEPPDPQVERQVQLIWENAMINKYLEKTLKDRVVTEEKVRAYYEAKKKDFLTPEMIHAAHIMFKISPQVKPEEKQAARQKAEAALKRLQAGENFQNLARQVSEDEISASHGGDLSYFARGHLPPEFEEATFALKKEGELSGIVETRMGLHIIKLLGRKSPELIPYADVREKIMNHLGPANRQDAYRTYIEELRRTNNVKISNAALMTIVTTGSLKETVEKLGYQKTVPPGTSPSGPGGYAEGMTR